MLACSSFPPFLRRAAILAACASSTPAGAGAQDGSTRDSVAAALARGAFGSACVRALPASAYAPVQVFVYGEVADSSDHAARPTVDLAAQGVSRRLRLALWGTSAALERSDSLGRLPAADSLFGTRALAGGVRVVARRGGTITWRPVVAPGAEAADSGAALLLARAVAAAHGANELYVLDENIRGDSLVFFVEYVRPTLMRFERGAPLVRRRNPFPVLLLRGLPELQAGISGALPVRYPSDLQSDGYEGKVVVRFVVTAAGRADMATFRDAHPEVAKALAPTLRGAYTRFLAAVRDAVGRARFLPADMGGCPVSQLVEMPVSFALVR